MTMIKVIDAGSQDYGVPAASLVKVANRQLRGIDLQEFEKRASDTLTQQIQKIASQLHNDEPLIHLIAMGATEDYGANRNADGFTRDTCRQHHGTFKKFAHFYRDHKNKDPKKCYGHVKFATWNEPMKRVELLVALNGSKAAADRNGGLIADRELEKLSSGKEIPVSMACVLDPTYPVLTRDRGYVAIADIKVGDYVWTKNGRWKRVYQLNRRKYTGKVFTFRVNGQPLPLELTADHPMWAKIFDGSREGAAVKAKARRYFRDKTTFDAAPANWAHAEHIGVGDRFFYKPVTGYDGFGRINDVRLAAILGYYVAEGSFCYNGDKACTTEFSCNMDDSLPRRLPKLLATMYPDITVDIEPKENSDSGLAVKVYNTHFSEFLRNYVGQGVRTKQIPPEIFNAPGNVKLAFLGAWLDGDGWVDKKGGHWSTCNVGLVLQGRDLLASIGIPSSVYRIDHSKCKTSGYENSGVEYTLNVSHLDLWNLSGDSEKVADYPTPTLERTKPAAMRICPDGSYAYRIASVSSRYVSDAATYNFEVEDDESYSLGGFISHNCRVPYDVCSWCGNKSRTRDDYCQSIEKGGSCEAGGLKENLGALVEMEKNGQIQIHQLHADNPNPTFFDISHVFRPADRIAYVSGLLEKSAGHTKIGGAELAEAMGVTVPYEILVDNTQPANVQTMLKLAYQLSDMEAELESGRLPIDTRNMAGAFTRNVQGALLTPPSFHREKFAHTLRALTDARIALPLEHFISMVTDYSFEKAANTAMIVRQELPGIYSRMLSSGCLTDKVASCNYVPGDVAAPTFRLWAEKQASALSLSEPHVLRRAMRAVVQQESTTIAKAGLHKTASDNGPITKLAEEYALYKLAFLGALPEDELLPLTASLVLLQNYVN